MRPLSGIDSMFLSLESATNLFQVGAVSVLDPSTAPDGSPPPHEALRRVVETRLDRLPPFRTRQVRVPGGLDHPRWVDDDPDLAFHIRRGAIPQPGGERELARYAADVLSQPLDKSRPLWEIHVVEGLEGDLVAGVAKIHHSAIDGIAGAEATAALMDLEPVPVGDGPLPDIASEEVPSTWSLLGSACRSAGRRVIPTTRLLARLPGTALRLGIRNRLLDGPTPPGFFTSPRTPMARRVSRRRVAGLARVDMADVESVRQATHATVNDVILAVAASAVRLYLEERGELPADPLCGFVPVSVRADGDDPMGDVNRLSGMLVSLATDLDDPLRRLATISDSTRAAKDQHRVIGEDLFSELADLGVPALLGPTGRLVQGLGLTSRFPPFSVVVSSFVGPTFPLYCAGAELLAYHPFGPVIDGAALNITAMSYRGHIGFGLLACAEAVPDVEVVARLIPESMSELAKAVSNPNHARGGAPGPTRAVSARRRR